MKPYTKTASKYYDVLLYPEVKVAPKEVKFFKRMWGNKVKEVLDSGCGTGRLALELTLAGYKVTGIDTTPAMIEVAKEKSSGIRYKVADMRNYVSKKKFDAIVCGSNTIPHLITDKDIMKYFSCCFKNLRKKGTLIFDIWELDVWGGTHTGERTVGNVHLRYKEVDKKYENNMLEWMTTAKINDNGKKVEFVFGGKLKHRDRDELKRLLKEAGFSKVRVRKMKKLRRKTYFIASKD